MSENKEKEYLYSEIFYSNQGEGLHSGRPMVWVRFFFCNLTCSGFGQDNPTDPKTYKLPYEEFDVTTVDSVDQLPVWKYGCDSSYSWAKKFKSLAKSGTVDQIYQEVCNQLPGTVEQKEEPNYRPFVHPTTRQNIDLGITGGEPMIPRNQSGTAGLIKHIIENKGTPRMITIETNGSRKVKMEYWNDVYPLLIEKNIPLFFSISPKLYHVSGELRKRAINVETILELREFADYCIDDRWIYRESEQYPVRYYALESRSNYEPVQLKFVIGGNKDLLDKQWDEMEEVIDKIKAESGNSYWPIVIMPVGATLEQQLDPLVGEIVNRALKQGYSTTGRLQNYFWGNQIGT